MICVDSMRQAKWKWGMSCHLFDDNGDTDALHFFAAKLDLKKKWLHKDRRLPHYDISMSKRRAAVKLGAREVTRGYTGSIIKKGML